jgi:predicted unusual protein kinase regulating ubiquinone biosynthesis (AarF/ABC1/UbiB family)
MPPHLPIGRLRRAIDVARVGARTGASLLLSRGAESAAAQAAEVLGNLRGLAAKLGQTVSYVDGLVPPEQRAVFESALGRLQRATLTSSPEAIARTLEVELGAPPHELFATWDPAPVASASIGQVHRARLADGREVAVKVQHPDIERAIESDLANIGMLEGVITLAGPRGLEPGAILDEIVRRFREELDYRLEAEHQETFRALHADNPRIHVPAVIRERSSGRVLTSEWVSGASLEEACGASTDLRRTYAEVLWHFVFRGNLVGGKFNADPHPGNYLFHADGSVTFLDFGCVQPIPEYSRRTSVAMHRAALDGDEGGFAQAVQEMLGTRGGRYGDAALRYVRSCFEPMFSAPFNVSHEYAASLFTGARDLKADMFAKDGSFVAPPPHLAMMNRLQFGFYSVLARLDVAADYARVERSFLDEAIASFESRPNTKAPPARPKAAE